MKLLYGTALFLVLATGMSQAAEWRCGWIMNPTPGNFSLLDSKKEWILSTQGAEGVPGMENLPDFSGPQWVETNRSYGYGCACLRVEIKGNEITSILAARQKPLAKCSADKKLPKAE